MYLRPHLWLALGLGLGGPIRGQTVERTVDVCVYGATPAGLLAAVAVAREGRSVVVVEPSRWVGGMLGAGLKPMQDCPNINATGGLTRQLLESLGQPEQRVPTARLKPADIRRDFLALLDQHRVPVIYDHRLARCEKEGTRIVAARFDRAPFGPLGCPIAEPEVRDALRVAARVFIDASYEGDLLPAAGVGYRVGREAATEFGEELAGIQPPTEAAPIDPFVIPGDRASGLLPLVEDNDGAVGEADGRTQAYNYRYYTTTDPAFRIPLTAPAGYDPRAFELVGRYVEYLVRTIPDEQALNERLSRIFPGVKNAGEWNYQRASLFSMAPVGISHLYADGDPATRARIWQAHQDYLRGLHTFLSTDPRVPARFRDQTAAIGLDGRHHGETGGWPHQLYIRVARRLRGLATITAHDVYNRTTIDDPIGLAQYGIDTYPARRIWFERDGQVWVGLEGKMFIGGNAGPTNVPYPIPYRAIVPRPEECTNLLVPVCFSASHLGYASARMEPVFMICGESAGLAAVQAVTTDRDVQEIDQAAYRAALEAAGQALEWTRVVAGLDPLDRYADWLRRLREECDTNGDGLVTRPEWNAGKPGWEWLFDKIDTNRDGHIDPPEYAAWQLYKDTHPNWQRERPAGN